MLIVACTSNQTDIYTEEKADTQIVEKSTITHAKGFSINVVDGFKIITINNIDKAKSPSHKYILYRRDKKSAIKSCNDCIPIKIPIQKAIFLSTALVPFSNQIGVNNSIVGISYPKYVKNANVKQQIADGKIKNVGAPGKLDYETIVSLKADVIITNPITSKELNKLRELGITTIINAEYLETTPLGRAEWIKFMAHFYNKEEEAIAFFNQLVKRYETYKALTNKLDKPSVFAGRIQNGVWYVPGGDSYVARFFEDAGANYIWKDNTKSGSIPLEFESVLAKAKAADFWRILTYSNESFTYLKFYEEDNRYSNFKAFKEKKVIESNLKKVDFYGQGLLEPDIILADLINIFHPGLLDNHQAKYYALITDGN